MDFNKLTTKSQSALAAAQDIAAVRSHQQVDVAVSYTHLTLPTKLEV